MAQPRVVLWVKKVARGGVLCLSQVVVGRKGLGESSWGDGGARWGRGKRAKTKENARVPVEPARLKREVLWEDIASAQPGEATARMW